MEIEFDSDKNEKNIAKHGLDFADFEGFDAEPLVIADDRRDYGEPRYRAFGRIAGLGYSIAYTLRGSALRLISWRRAHDKEMRRYE